MKSFWGKLRTSCRNHELLRNLSNFIGPSIKLLVIFITYFGSVSSCPLTLVSAKSPSVSQISDNYFHPIVEDITAINLINSYEDENGRSRSIAYQSSTNSVFSKIIGQLFRLLVRNVMGERWLSEEKALRRLGHLKSSLFNYYARQNLFGGTVETARDGIGFPSLEGALLSLAFLTFSVFLIDLIQTLLNKLRLKNTATSGGASVLGRAINPTNSPLYYQYSLINGTSTNPLSIDTLTTLSSKVTSAIEKPWKYTSSPVSTSIVNMKA